MGGVVCSQSMRGLACSQSKQVVEWREAIVQQGQQPAACLPGKADLLHCMPSAPVFHPSLHRYVVAELPVRLPLLRPPMDKPNPKLGVGERCRCVAGGGQQRGVWLMLWWFAG